MFMNLAQLIEKRLAELNISQAKLADILNEPPQAIVHWKTRGRIPVNKVTKVADALQLRVEELLPGKLGQVQEEAPAYGDMDVNTKRMLRTWQKLPREVQLHYIALMEYSPAPSADVVNKLPSRRQSKKSA